MVDETYLSVEEVAKRFGVQEKTITKYVRQGNLKAVQNPISNSIIGFRAADIDAFLAGKPQEQSENIITVKLPNEGTDDELGAIKQELAVTKVKMELELTKRGLEGFVEYDKRKAEVEQKEKELKEREAKCLGKETEVENRERAVAVMEHRALESDEERKKLLIDAQNRIANVEEVHKKAREEDEKRRASKYKMMLTPLDTLAALIYNPPPSTLSNRLQGKMIAALEPLMEGHGSVAKFDKLNRYVPVEDRYGAIETHTKEVAVSRETFSENGLNLDNVKNCYRMCVNVYRWMRREPTYGHEFCRGAFPIVKWLQHFIVDKSDDEILKKEIVMYSLFKNFHKTLMDYAELYQNDQRGDWVPFVNWLCSRAEVLENRLGVGVTVNDWNVPLRTS